MARTDPRQPVTLSALRLPLVAGVSVAIGSTAVASSLAPIAIALTMWLAYLLVASPEVALLGVMLARPMLDLWDGGVAIPGSPTVLDASAALAILLIILGTAYIASKNTDVLRIPLVLPFMAFIVVATVSLLASAQPGQTIASLIRLVAQLVLFVLTFSVVQTSERPQRLVFALAGAGVLPVLWGFGQIALGNGVYLHPVLAQEIAHPRLAGPFGEGLTLGSFLITPLLLSLALLLGERERGVRIVLSVLVVFYVVALYFTLARGPWLAFVAALYVFGVVRYRPLIALAPLAVILALFLVPGIGQRWAPVFESPEQTTAANRVVRWEGAIEVFADNPILGAGFGVGDLEAGTRAVGRASPAHSDYLRVLADTGVLGMVTYVWLLIASGGAAVLSYQRSRSSLGKAVALSFIAVWLAFLLLRISGNILTLQIIQYYYWSLAALAVGLAARESSNARGGAH